MVENFKMGLEGVVAGTTTISDVDADSDQLLYRGYSVRELAEGSNFEEVAYLILYGRLPNDGEYEEFAGRLREERFLDPKLIRILGELPSPDNAMDFLRTGISALAGFDPDRNRSDQEANFRKAERLIAKAPLILALFPQGKTKRKLKDPRSHLSHAANFLYQLTGKEPSEVETRAFDLTLILYAEHGFNASTFAARVTSSTLSDMYSAVTAAVGTLKGPLHGGANEEAMKMLLEIGTPERARPWVETALMEKKKIMGFGHRVYKKQDARAPILKTWAGKLEVEKTQSNRWTLLAGEVEAVMKEKKGLFPNVDFPCAYLYYLLEIPIPLYTGIFASSRMAGWTSHIIEQLGNNRLIRPLCLYQGEKNRTFIPLKERK